MVLDRATFDVGYAYVPFMPKHSYQVQHRYRFSGKLPLLPIHIDD